MPMQETSLPVGATALKVTANGRDYSILLDTDTFDRTGEDGYIPIIPLCRGDEYVGEVLEGQWKKGWTDTIDEDQAFTALIDSGLLKFKGEADAAGTWGYGYIKSMHPVPMMNNTEVTVELEVPINDVVAGANRAIAFRFFLCQNKVVTERPSLNDNTLYVEIRVTDNGLLMTVAKSIEDADTDLYTGSTYIDGSGISETADKFTIWRIVFHDGVAGATVPSDDWHMHVYLKQGVDRATAEAATENQLSNSPYDISDILFEVGYPAYQASSQNADYYDDGTEAISTYFRVNYPSHFSLKYDFADADVGKGDVELWDGDPDLSTSVQVFDEDHVFINNLYAQNGLLRLSVDEGVDNGVDISYWTGVTWIEIMSAYAVYLITDDEYLICPFLQRIVKISPEEIIIEVKLRESSTEDDDYFTLGWMTLKRGLYGFDFTIKEVYPIQTYQFYIWKAFGNRWVYAPDGNVSDDDLNITFTNATPSDNFTVSFDDDGLTSIVEFSVDKEPTDFYGDGTGQVFFRVFDIEEEPTILLSVVPFSLVTNLFIEAENGDYTGTTPGNDANASPVAGNNYVCLDAVLSDFQTLAGEYSTYQFDAGDDLPEGRYLAVIRARYETEETMRMYVWNDADNVYRNEENAKVAKVLAATFGYHSIVFDITAADVAGTDTFAIVAEKVTADTDEIRIDYFLIVPIGNGESWPQDLAHAAMRNYNKPKRVFTR